MKMASIKVGSLNCQGQTKMSLAKQLFLQDILRIYNFDILCTQETLIENDTFENCDYILNNFTIITNNSLNNFGTAVFVRNTFDILDVKFDTEGQIIVFNIQNITFGNIYAKAGTDNESRKHRENMFCDTLPNMLRLRKSKTILCGDWNSIIEKRDCTHYPDSKISPSLKKLVQVIEVRDDFRTIYGNNIKFSRHYKKQGSKEGGSRIDRSYSSGGITPIMSNYHPVAMSDHSLLEVIYEFNEPFDILHIPKSKIPFKICPEVVRNSDFCSEIEEKK